jgi:hypothetical protein
VTVIEEEREDIKIFPSNSRRRRAFNRNGSKFSARKLNRDDCSTELQQKRKQTT